MILPLNYSAAASLAMKAGLEIVDQFRQVADQIC